MVSNVQTLTRPRYHSCLISLVNLLHDTLLSIMVGILQWVELVQQAWLLLPVVVRVVDAGADASTGGGRGVVAAGADSGAGGVVSAASVTVVVGTISLGDGGGASSAATTEGVVAGAAEGLVNWAWCTGELISALLAAAEVSARSLELAHGHGRKLGDGVELGLVVVNLMHWDSGVDNGWLDNLFLNDWLDGLVDVVVDVLASNGWGGGGSGSGLADLAGAAELVLLGLDSLSDVVIVAVTELAGLDADLVVDVLLWEDLLVLDWLDGGVVMILVNLAVNDLLCLLVLGLGDVLVHDGWVDSLADGGVVVTILAEEGGNCLLGLIHFELIWLFGFMEGCFFEKE